MELDRLGRDLRHLINLVHDLTRREVGLKILAGQGAQLDTTTANGRLVFGIFAALAEFEHALIVERTQAGLASARARGRNGGRPFKMTTAKLRLAQAAMGKPGTKVGDLCTELGITRQTLYRHVDPNGLLRPDGEKLLSRMRIEMRPSENTIPNHELGHPASSCSSHTGREKFATGPGAFAWRFNRRCGELADCVSVFTQIYLGGAIGQLYN
jgi:Resolvase, N terminal domain